MQKLKINQLSESGVLEAEIDALERISSCLPPVWLAYSNFEFRDKSFGNREIDLVLVTHDCILVIELKNWNGKLISDGSRWICNGQNRGKSPVIVTNDKAKKLKSLLQNKEGHHFGSIPFVAGIVVLCGSAGPQNLSEGDKDFTVTLNDFCSIGADKQFKKLFPTVHRRKDALYKEKELFNRFFSLKTFDARKHRFNNYIPIGKPFFSHKEGLYEEWLAEHERTKGHRALLRTWDLTALPPGYSTEQQWREITTRESEVIGYLKENLGPATVKSTILAKIGEQSESEFSSANFDLHELPTQSQLLESYINKNSKRITFSDRVQISRNLIEFFSQLHEVNVAHRDISETSIWTGHDLMLSVSRWLAAAFPEGKTVGELRAFLHSGRSVAPEDELDIPSNPFKRDVYLLGRVVHFVLSGTQLPVEDRIVTFQPLNPQSDSDVEKYSISRIESVLEKALSWDPGDRYANAVELADDFEMALPLNTVGNKVYRKKLIPFTTSSNPYASYPIKNSISDSPVHLYESEKDNIQLIIKTWPSLQPSDTDEGKNLRIYEFLSRCADLKRINHPNAQKIVDFGISPIGLFIAVEKSDGHTLEHKSENPSGELPERIRLAISIIKAIRSLHESGIAHSDIKPSNILISAPINSIPDVVFIDLPDIDIAGNKVSSDEYATYSDSADPLDKDRFACVMVLAQVLGGAVKDAGGIRSVEFEDVRLEDVEEEINQRLSSDLYVKSLSPLLHLLERTLSQDELPTLPRVSIRLKTVDSRLTFYPDDETYFATFRVLTGAELENTPAEPVENRYIEVSLIGVGDILQIVWDTASSSVVVGRLHHGAPIHIKKRATHELRSLIIFEPSQHNDFQELEGVLRSQLAEDMDAFLKSYLNQESVAVSREEKPIKRTAGSLGISTEKIWSALVEAESNVMPELEIADEPERLSPTSKTVQFVYERTNAFPIEFDSSERVAVQLLRNSGEPWTVGELDRSGLSSEQMSVRLTRNARLSVGDKLRLEGFLAKASYDKRRQAVERLISGESVLPRLIEWIAGTNEELAKEESAFLNLVPETREKLNLNEAQARSLELALSATPISLIQGPPGTGKTLFIAALAYILSSSANSNMLITSQSNEAVNNCIEKLVSVFEENIEHLDLVRVGALETCSESASRYHIDSIQQRYRNRFESEMRTRLEASAKGLGLPDQFISQYVRTSLALRPISLKFRILDLENPTSRDNQDVEHLKDRAQARVKRISQRLEWPVDMGVDIAERQLLDQLIEIHNISNKDALFRLDQLINLAFEWNEALISPHGNFAEFLTRTKQIVVGTCVGIGRKKLNILSQKFDWVIIDEAARCTSGELAVPSSVGERLVLVGDHNQLPPLYPTEVIEEARDILRIEKDSDITGSDFKRIIESNYGKNSSELLREQYRMNPSIGSMVSNIFYKDQLQNKKSEMFLPEKDLPYFLVPEVSWIDTAHLGPKAKESKEKDPYGRETKSFLNKQEITQILSLLEQMEMSESTLACLRDFHSKTSEPPIGVICSYAGQKRELLRRFRQKPHSDEFRQLVKIDTVDSYQGKENLIIILSLVRSNAAGNSGFLNQPERINVAVSRAMERLLIVGDGLMWKNTESPLGNIYSYIQAREQDDHKFTILKLSA